MVLADWHPEEAVVLIASLPACLAAHRAAASLRPLA
jgi:hypothetical protein